MSKITQNTLIPLSAVFVIALAVMGFADARSTAVEAYEISKSNQRILRHMDERLSHMEGKMGMKPLIFEDEKE